MKKYRVVRAYLDREVGDIVHGVDYKNMDGSPMLFQKLSDKTAFQLGALEEIKAWEPKDGEQYYLAMPWYTSVQTWRWDSDDKRWFSRGFIYPTREQAEECRKRMLEAARKYKEEVATADDNHIKRIRND